MEAAHHVLLQAELDGIQETGAWFGLPEFTLESERSQQAQPYPL